MKVLVFTDTHAVRRYERKILRKARKERPDICICCGDWSIMGTWNMSFFEKLAPLCKRVLIIYGNHETEEDARRIVERIDRVRDISYKLYKIGNYVFLGIGDLGLSLYDPAEFERIRRVVRKYWERVKDLHRVIVSHAPPYRTNLDWVGEWHVGSLTVRRAIRIFRPEIVFCGHIHECFGCEDSVLGATVINPGPEGRIVEL